MKYFIATYGCQANHADSERIASRLKTMGYAKTDKIEKAKLVVVNACSVRQSAMDRVYAKIQKIQDPRGRVKIILAGCVLPTDKKKLKDRVTEIWHPDEYFDLMPLHSNPESAYVPIMTGCNNFCSYCAVPYTRGREYSKSTKEIISEVKSLIKKGYREIWLLGQNVNSYQGKFDFSSFGLAVGSLNKNKTKAGEEKSNFPLLLKIINSLSGNFEIKFLTSHPKDMSDKLIKTIAGCEKVSKEIHLPLQSGDNVILKKMNRKYTVGYYKNLVKKIRKYIPGSKISTDIIVGFPGETKKQFQNTAKAIREIKFSKAYIACYSSRPGTLAAKLKDDIPRHEKKERRKILVKILEKTNMPKPKIIVIIGPTGSGKSALAVNIAKKFNGEIVSADSRQIYRGMSIGTAKPTKKEMRETKHHLINIKNPDEDYSAGEYKKDAITAINNILEREKLPIFVGGTGLYVSAVLNNWEIPEIKENKTLRRKLEKEIANKGLAFVFEKLVELDPEAAYIVDPKNPRRVIRAFEIAMISGKKFSEQRKKGKPLYDALEIGLNPPLEILKKKIAKRIKQMIKDGLINEVKKLTKKYDHKIKAFNAIGYREIIDYLKHRTTLQEAVERMDKNTWHYAKRQITWFKKYNPKTHWLESKNEAVIFGLVRKFLNKKI